MRCSPPSLPFAAIKKEDPNGDFTKKIRFELFKTQFLQENDAILPLWNGMEISCSSGWPLVANRIWLALWLQINKIKKRPIKPGPVGKAVCGYDIKIFNE
jgi:propionyl-CoA synthetase